jgi:hypothetical protein
MTAAVETVDDREMRDRLLTQLAMAEYLGNSYFASFNAIDPAIGAQLVDFNRVLTRRAVNTPYVKRFGRAKATYRSSNIVCLYGKPDFTANRNIYPCSRPCSRPRRGYGIMSSSMSATAPRLPGSF